MERKLVSLSDLYADKAAWRREQAAKPWEEKIKILIKFQQRAYAIKRQTGRDCKQPWGMQDEQTQNVHLQ